MRPSFQLADMLPTLNDAATRRQVNLWLITGVTALGLAGLLALLLAGARSPGVAAMLPIEDFFHVALVVHVDLSVLVWFLAMACLFFSLYGTKDCPIPYLPMAAWGSFSIGALLMAASPFLGKGEPLMVNYIPMLTNDAFRVSLGLIAAGTLLSLVQALLAFGTRGKPETSANPLAEMQRFGVFMAALITVVAGVAFMGSANHLPDGLMGADYYEQMFWAGGHLLQFTHTQMLMVAWLWLAAQVGLSLPFGRGMLRALYVYGLLAVLPGIYPLLRWEVGSAEFMQFYTHHMIVFTGLASIVMMGGLLYATRHYFRIEKEWRLKHRALFSALVMSVLLYAAGGFIGYLIRGSNVTIPAHYHGSIVGITLAFMGIAYWLLPALGLRPMSHTRMAFWQPIVLGVGQLMHITGLAWSGGYGVARKVADGESHTEGALKIAFGLMGAGGGIAFIGGVMFVLVMLRGLRKHRAQ
jgi:uncharacterized membrane protein